MMNHTTWSFRFLSIIERWSSYLLAEPVTLSLGDSGPHGRVVARAPLELDASSESLWYLAE